MAECATLCPFTEALEVHRSVCVSHEFDPILVDSVPLVATAFVFAAGPVPPSPNAAVLHRRTRVDCAHRTTFAPVNKPNDPKHVSGRRAEELVSEQPTQLFPGLVAASICNPRPPLFSSCFFSCVLGDAAGCAFSIVACVGRLTARFANL